MADEQQSSVGKDIVDGFVVTFMFQYLVLVAPTQRFFRVFGSTGGLLRFSFWLLIELVYFTLLVRYALRGRRKGLIIGMVLSWVSWAVTSLMTAACFGGFRSL